MNGVTKEFPMTISVQIVTPPGDKAAVVTVIDIARDEATDLPITTTTSEVIPPGVTRTLYAYEGRSIAVTEVAMPAKDVPQDS